MEDMTVKFKRVDTGKPWIGGKLTQGKYGPQIGMKMTPELRSYLDSVQVGGWLNFNIYKPFEEKKSQGEVSEAAQEINDEVPF